MRSVQSSMFPDYRSEVNVGPLIQSVQHVHTNAELIANIAPLYLDDRTVLDVTYGKGKWWTIYRPERFTFHDLALDGIDFTDLPYPDGTFDVVTYDPPYVANTSGNTFMAKYGVAEPRSQDQLRRLMVAGFTEAVRVCTEFVLVKCMNATDGGELQTLGPFWIMQAAETLPVVLHDQIIHASGPPVGNGYNIRQQVRSLRCNSELLVFRKTGRCLP